MRVAITGATGLIGSALVPALAARGHSVLRLVRSAPRGAGEARWDPARGEVDTRALATCDGVIHLAGESLDQRWTPAARRRIVQSRAGGTQTIARALAALPDGPRVLVSASAMGYYGDRGEALLDEASPPGSGFLAEVVRQWEDATAPAASAGVRVVCTRFGLVLSAGGGALARMLPPFRLGLGGPFGDGRAWWSWIGIHDLVAIVIRALEDPALAGPINVVAPEPVRNATFVRTLGHVLHRPAWLPVPRAALVLALGDLAREAVLASIRVQPARLVAAGHAWQTPALDDTLHRVLGR